jgi:ribosomal protein S18 acetylase RimI-like enzyme
MERRQVDPVADYAALADMQRRSWEINFPGEVFVEPAFRESLRIGAERDDLFAYTEQGRLVGWLWLDWRFGRRRVHIRHIQVAEEYWGQGYGKRIITDAIALARQRGRTVISLNVTKSNVRAMRLYAGLGFRVYREFGPRQEMRLDLGERDLVPEPGAG